MSQLEGAALPVEILLLILPHAVDALAIHAPEGGAERIVAAKNGLKFPGTKHQGVFPIGFLQKHLPLLIDEGDDGNLLPAADLHPGSDFSAAKRGVPLIRNDSLHIIAGEGIQQGEAVIPQLSHGNGAHAEGVGPPGKDAQGFSVVAPQQLLTANFKKLHVIHLLEKLIWNRTENGSIPPGLC